jgi:threonyl-tRNA synthetase
VRVDVDTSDERLGYKIRLAETEKVPYALVVGQKEQEAHAVGVRRRHEGDLGAMPVAELAARIQREIATRAL